MSRGSWGKTFEQATAKNKWIQEDKTPRRPTRYAASVHFRDCVNPLGERDVEVFDCSTCKTLRCCVRLTYQVSSPRIPRTIPPRGTITLSNLHAVKAKMWKLALSRNSDPNPPTTRGPDPSRPTRRDIFLKTGAMTYYAKISRFCTRQR